MFVLIDSLNNKIEAQDIYIQELKKIVKLNEDQITDLDNCVSEISDRFNL